MKLNYQIYIIRLLILGLVFLLPFRGYSQQYNFKNYSVESGLPYIQIFAMFQDSKGNLWVGVPDGLYLFNATKDKFEKQSLNYEGNPLNILSIHEDKSKNIWKYFHIFG